MYQKADLPPPTFCETCYRAEMTPWQRFRYDLRKNWGVPTAGEIIADQTRWMARVLSIAAQEPPPSAYDRHRAEFERTGNEIELDRMLRHVETP